MSVRWGVNTLLGLWQHVLGRRHSHVCCRRRRTISLFWWVTLVILVLLQGVSALPKVEVFTNAPVNSKEGDTVELTCLITALTSAETINSVKWKKSGVTFTELEKLTVSNPLNRFSVEAVEQSTFRAYTLTITGVERQDSGMYSCHVGFTDSDNAPSEITQSALVSVVHYIPPDHSPSCQTLSDVNLLTIGASITLNCFTQKGNPVVNMTWTRKTPSGTTDEIPLKQIVGTDLAKLSYSFNVTQEHDGIELICSITSEAFPDFQRNCTIGPLVVIDIQRTTTGEPMQTTLYGPSPRIPPKTSPSTTTTTMTTGKPIQTTLHGPSPVIPVTTSPSTTMNTSSIPASNEPTSEANSSSNFTTQSSAPSTSSNSSIPRNATGLAIATTAFYDLTDNITLNPDPKPDDPNSSRFALSLVAIIGISAGVIILLFLICNSVMLLKILSCHKDGDNGRSLRSRRSVQRENRRRRRSRRRHSDIDEETQA